MAQESVVSPARRLKILTAAPGLTLWSKFRGICLLLAIFAVTLVACTGGTAADLSVTMYTGASQVGGEQINLAQLRGKPVVLNFWAGLCPPCRAEMPDLQEFHNEFNDRVTLIGIDVGQFTGLGNHNDATELLESLKITYPTGYTDDSSVMQEYGVLTMPTTVFINSRGEVFRKWSGALDRQTLDRVTNEMLAQEPG